MGSLTTTPPLPDETATGDDVWHRALPVTGRRDHGIGSVEGKVTVTDAPGPGMAPGMEKVLKYAVRGPG